MIDTVTWSGGAVRILDQTRLPGELVYLDCSRWEEVADAIRRLAVRGAPAIGVAAAYGVALAAARLTGDAGFAAPAAPATGAELATALSPAIDGLAATRPTAVNLFRALGRMRRVLEDPAMQRAPARAVSAALLRDADALLAEDLAMSEAMARHGEPLIPAGARILTHCNTGGLATGGGGTALAVAVAAHRAGKGVSVVADETRPLLQGARLTMWECAREGIPATLLCDGAAASIMSRGLVDLVMVGADRIAANGDAANKVGTYSLAVLARHHGLPFYVVAPWSTVDLGMSSGNGIPIEERDPGEVTAGPLGPIAPAGARALNPAFDVTPGALITAIVTDRGVARAPYLAALAAQADS